MTLGMDGLLAHLELYERKRMILSAYAQRWLDDPDGGLRYTGQGQAIRAHDQSCVSLGEAWLPRKGGVSCPSDLTECEGGCGVTFFWEGMHPVFEACPFSEHWYCACCATKATVCSCGDEEDYE